jgi:hypothetical protein
VRSESEFDLSKLQPNQKQKQKQKPKPNNPNPAILLARLISSNCGLVAYFLISFSFALAASCAAIIAAVVQERRIARDTSRLGIGIKGDFSSRVSAE